MESIDRPSRRAKGGVLKLNAVDKGVSISAQIATQLVNAIRNGDLTVGTRLPSEATLATQFNVSRASVREALSSLQFSGYIDTVRGSGTIVVSTTAIGQAPLGEGGITTVTALIDVFEARLLLEPEVLRQGALNPLPTALQTAERMIRGMEVSIASLDLHHSDLGLHRALLRSCGNQILVEAAERLLISTDGRLWRKVRDRSWRDRELMALWLKQHIAIADAVVARDGAAAEAACREHLQSVLSNAISSLKLNERDRLRCDALLMNTSVEKGKSE